MSNARTNDATRANINRNTVFASGTFKNVWLGIYTQGARRGQRCVAKEFKTGSVIEEHYFEEEMNIVQRTQEIIDDFDNAGVIGNRRILLNTPEIWEYTDDGVLNLCEPMIHNFEKFNSNSGWASLTGSEWSEAMQALSHFSYHDSNRQFLLCDLQGGVYSDG